MGGDRKPKVAMMIKQTASKLTLVLGGLIVAVGLMLQPTPSQARVVVGVGVGVPFFPFYGPYYGPGYGYGYYPPPVVYQPAPVYAAPAVQPTYAPAAQPASWYYCDNPRGYYPYVNNCSAGWRQVPAAPPQH
jgi:hypothetical protein